MKKFIVIALALFLALPAISYAGSATSRYDVTIGGMVFFDLGYNTQYLSDQWFAAPKSRVDENVTDEFGNTFWSAGGTRLFFLVKGPDAGTAKTSAVVEGDFWADATGGTSNNLFRLRLGMMKFDWKDANLMIGQYHLQWGMPYSIQAVGAGDFAPFFKLVRVPQITYRQNLGEEFNFMVGLIANSNQLGPGMQTSNYSRNVAPHLDGEIAYKTDKCGTIGPLPLMVGLGGFYGQEKQTFTVVNAGTTTFEDDTDNAWAVALRYYVPIIPEKKGNKAGALGLSGLFFTGQNFAGVSYLQGGTSLGSYQRGDLTIAAQTLSAGFGQLTYYFRDDLYANVGYGYLKYNMSARARLAAVTPLESDSQVAISLMYSLNPAVLFGFQASRIDTKYGANVGTAAGSRFGKDGRMDTYRVGAIYFF